MNKELLVKKLMDTTITFESVKKILISELDDRVEYIGQLENLKLYDVSYYIGEKLNQIDNLSQSEFYENYCHIFELFCEDSYNIFEDREEKHNTKREYLGKTSSFYIDTNYYDGGVINYYYASDFRSEYDIEKKKSMLLDEFLYSVLNTDEVYIEEEFMNEQDFNYMINEFKDFLDTIEEIYDTYEYIRVFKENQLNILKDWYENFYKEEYGDILNGKTEE